MRESSEGHLTSVWSAEVAREGKGVGEWVKSKERRSEGGRKGVREGEDGGRGWR